MAKIVCNLSCLILICCLLPCILSAANEKAATVGEFLSQQIEAIDNATSELIVHDVISVERPPTSIFCNKTNTDKIKLFTKAEDFIYVLSDNELLAMDVNGKRDIEVQLIATLLRFDAPALEIQIETLQDILVVVLKTAGSLHVYLKNKDGPMGVDIEPIQKMRTISEADRFVLFKSGEELMLVTYEVKTESANELIFYKWKNSFFSKESTELIDLPNKSNMFVYNEDNNEPLILSIGLGNTTRVVIMKLNLETNRWVKLQSMHFKQDYIEHYAIDGQLYLIGCSTETFCAIYKWMGSEFRRHVKMNGLIFEKIKKISYKHDIVVMENFERKLSFYTSDDIAATQPGLTITKSANVSDVTIYRSPVDQQLYFVEFLTNKTSLAVNFYALSVTKSRDAGDGGDAKGPIECVARLKAYLKNRIPKVQSSHQNADKLKSQDNILQMDNKKILKTRFVNLRNSKAMHVQMPIAMKTSALQLQRMAIDSNIQVERTRRELMKPTRPEIRMNDQRAAVEAMDNIIIKDLIYNGKEPIFADLLLRSSPLTVLADDIKLRNITASKIVVQSNRINKIPLGQLINATVTNRVSGIKNFKNLKVKNLVIASTLNDVPLAFMDPSETEKPFELSEDFEFIGDINVKHLRVKTINGFNVPAVMADAFLKGERNTINGTLIVQNVANVDQLEAKSLMEVPVENLMTTSTDQTIKADLFINKFFVAEMTTDTINDEKLSETVALVNQVNQIEVPTQFMTIHVLKNLNIKEEGDENGESRAALTQTIDTLKRHVIGTQTSDLSQIYSGQVVIQGSLWVKDVQLLSPKTKLVVGGKEIPQNISANYWMKSLKQEIKVPKFTVNNPTMSTANLIASFLNGHPTKEHLQLDSKVPQGPTVLRFENAVVEGDVVGHRDNFPSLLSRLNESAVPLKGPPVFIQSAINFREKLAVRNLETGFINQAPVNELVHANQPQIVLVGSKSIKDLQVNELDVDGALTADNFNNVNLKTFTSDAVRIDEPIELDQLKLKKFEASQMSTEFFEDHQFNEFISSLEKEFQFRDDGTTRTMRNVRVTGDVNFGSNVAVNTINNQLQLNEFLNLLVLKNEPSQGIGGSKSFKDVIITDLEGTSVNGFPINRLLYQSLLRGAKQTISGEFFVKNLKTKSLRARSLNNIAFNQFIDKTKLNLPVQLNLNVGELHVRNLDSRSSSHDISKMIELVHFPQRSNWSTISVIGETWLPLQESSPLDRIVNLGVTRDGTSQAITGRVEVASYNFYIEHLVKPDHIIVAKENFINLHVIYADSVKTFSKAAQTIRGFKTFISPIYVNSMVIMNPFFSSNEINGVNIKTLNKTIVRGADVIDKQKSFGHLRVHEVELSGNINGLKPETLVVISNNAVTLPQLKIDNLEVGFLKTFMLSGTSFKYFIDSRMRKFDGPPQDFKGVFSVKSLEMLTDTVVTSINDVFINDAVFSQSDQLQEILGSTIVNGNVTLDGISVINQINEVDFAEFMRNSVVKHQNHTVDYMELPATELKNGLEARHSINGHQIGELLSSDAHTPKLDDLMSLIGKIETQIDELNTAKRMRTAKPKRLLYIDHDPGIQINYAGARDKTQKCIDNSIELTQFNSILVRQKRDTEMNIEVPSAKFTVRPNLHCRHNVITTDVLSVSWSFKSELNVTSFRNFSFIPSEISDVNFIESKKGVILMILTLQNHENRSSHVGIIQLHKGENDWFEHQPNIVGLNYITKTGIVETSEEQFLIISSFNEAVPSDSDYVLILKLDDNDKFVEYQKRLAGERFDIILGLSVPSRTKRLKPKTFLLLAQEQSKHLYIYRSKEMPNDFVFQRKIPFESEIVEVVVVFINNDAPYFIVSLQSGDFCIFEWKGIESWKAKQCGHFLDINRVQTYEYLKRQHLFLTSATNTGTALTVHRQGDLF